MFFGSVAEWFKAGTLYLKGGGDSSPNKTSDRSACRARRKRRDQRAFNTSRTLPVTKHRIGQIRSKSTEWGKRVSVPVVPVSYSHNYFVVL